MQPSSRPCQLYIAPHGHWEGEVNTASATHPTGMLMQGKEGSTWTDAAPKQPWFGKNSAVWVGRLLLDCSWAEVVMRM